MILRFRGRDGTYRVTVDGADSFASAVIALAAQLPPHGALRVALRPGGAAHAETPDWDRAVAELGLKHGDMFFVEYDPPADAEIAPNGTSTSQGTTHGRGRADLQFDAVDDALDVADGKIARGRSPLCRHGARGMCEYCQPLEPYDEAYRVEHGTKHLSYHAYVKKLQDENNGRKQVLETPRYSVRVPCPAGHAPWPASICSKCQPSAISLQLQRFRMVDHVEFADPRVVNDFIEYWRQTSTQRIGVLMGEYARYDVVPLGIKAVVHAIWEPPQDGVADGVTLGALPDATVTAAAEALGLRPVGVIFTDLTDAGKGDGTVLAKRHARSYFLSSLEACFAARLQIQHPSASAYAGDDGRFSSKFVTCVVSGNAAGEIDVAAYQVSAQAEAMVRADLVVPSANPAVMRIKPETHTRYVPDIFFKHVNEYKITVQEDAKPAFPVDYLLVSLTHGFPDVPRPRLRQDFAIENRPALRAQTVPQLAAQLELADGLSSDALTDLHLLAYLFSLGVLQPTEREALARLLRAERELAEREAAAAAAAAGDAAPAPAPAPAAEPRLAGEEPVDIIALATQLAHSDGFNTLRMLSSS